MCLYGNDINEQTTPLEARISFVVKFHKQNFIGKEALLKQKEQGLKRKRVGLTVIERGIPRPHQEIFKNEQKIGEVTSGTFSPLLKKGIAMAYVSAEHAEEGKQVNIKIRDKHVKAEIVKLPFYQRRGIEKVILYGKEYKIEEAKNLILELKLAPEF